MRFGSEIWIFQLFGLGCFVVVSSSVLGMDWLVIHDCWSILLEVLVWLVYIMEIFKDLTLRFDLLQVVSMLL